MCTTVDDGLFVDCDGMGGMDGCMEKDGSSGTHMRIWSFEWMGGLDATMLQYWCIAISDRRSDKGRVKQGKVSVMASQVRRVNGRPQGMIDV
jgi:hypothetical protein